MVQLILDNWLTIITTVVAIASAVAKVTTNAPTKKWLLFILTFVDALALTTGKTKLKDSNEKVI